MIFFDLSYLVLSLVCVMALLVSARAFYRSEGGGVVFLIPSLVFFYALPVFFDFISGVPFESYSYNQNLMDALEDPATNILYNLYLSLVLLLFCFIAKNKASTAGKIIYNSTTFFYFFRKWRALVWVVVFSPLMFALLSGDLAFYGEYVDRDRTSSNTFQILATKLAVVGMPLIAFYIAANIHGFKSSKNLVYLLSIFVLILFVLLNSYIHGKRSVVAVFLFFFFLAFFVTGVVSRRTLTMFVLSLVTIFWIFIYGYGKNIDGGSSLLEIASNLRIDFSRDYGVRFVIYHELMNDNNVLPYKGASYLAFLLFFIPRDFWEEKPYPYAVYFTNSFFGNFGGEYLYGWGLTTSFVSEAISNFGWFGLIVFPIFYIVAFRGLDASSRVPLKILGYLIMILLLVLHPIAFLPLILTFLILALVRKKIVIKLREVRY